MNDLPEGKVEINFENGDIYKGLMKDGQMHGEGEYSYANGVTYVGNFYYGSQWGTCTISYPPQF
jgi:hypothetical protein